MGRVEFAILLIGGDKTFGTGDTVTVVPIHIGDVAQRSFLQRTDWNAQAEAFAAVGSERPTMVPPSAGLEIQTSPP